MLKGNVIKGWITSIIGSLLLLSTLFLWFFGVIHLIWEGLAGFAMGTILLLAPRTIENNVPKLIDAIGNKLNLTHDVGESSSKPDNPD